MNKLISGVGLRRIINNTMDLITNKEDPMEEVTVEDIFGEKIPENQPILAHFRGKIADYGNDIYFIDKNNLDGSFGWNKLDGFNYSALKRIRLTKDLGFPTGYIVNMTYFKNKYVIRYCDSEADCTRIYTSVDGEAWKNIDYGNVRILDTQFAKMCALEDILVFDQSIKYGFVYTKDLVTFTHVPFEEVSEVYNTSKPDPSYIGISQILRRSSGTYLMIDSVGSLWETENWESFTCVSKSAGNQLGISIPVYSEFDKKFFLSYVYGNYTNSVSQYEIPDEGNSDLTYLKNLKSGKIVPYGDGAAIVGSDGRFYIRDNEHGTELFPWDYDYSQKVKTVNALANVYKDGDKYLGLYNGSFFYTVDNFVTLVSNRVSCSDGYVDLSGLVIPAVDGKVQING